MESLENATKSKKRKLSSTKIMLAITSMLVVILLVALVLLLIFYRQQPVEEDTASVLSPDVTNSENNIDALLEDAKSAGYDEAITDYKEDLKNSLLNGESLVSKLRTMYPNDVVYYDSDHYVFLPIVDTVPANTYNNEDILVLESGELQYAPGGNTTSVKGIDVSKYQGKIDWPKVAADGVEYAILRAGIRGYGTGAIVMDDTFEYNLKNATAAGIKVGAYFFTQAISIEEAEEEAQCVLDAVSGYTLEYPIVVDVEVIRDSEARTINLTQEQRTDYCIAFCEKVKAAGYEPMIYGNLKSFTDMLDISRLNDYGKWFAYYDSEIYFPYQFDIWQYTDTATVNGIDGPVDLNITFEEP